jgi:hypothetical protein
LHLYPFGWSNGGRINKDVAEIEAMMKGKAETIKPDLDAHKSPDSWARKGVELASDKPESLHKRLLVCRQVIPARYTGLP